MLLCNFFTYVLCKLIIIDLIRIYDNRQNYLSTQKYNNVLYDERFIVLIYDLFSIL